MQEAFLVCLIAWAAFTVMGGAAGFLTYFAAVVGVTVGVQIITYLQHWGLSDDNLDATSIRLECRWLGTDTKWFEVRNNDPTDGNNLVEQAFRDAEGDSFTVYDAVIVPEGEYVIVAAAVLLVRDPWHVQGLPARTPAAAADSSASIA